jgi:hypothetical protein
MGEVGGGARAPILGLNTPTLDPSPQAGGCRLNHMTTTYPHHLPSCHTPPITPHGRPAGEQWRGEPGGGFASPTGSKFRLRQGERPLEPDSSKNRRPGTVFVSYSINHEAKPSRGPLAATLACPRCHLGSRSLSDNRIAGGVFARLYAAESPRPCPDFATIACGQHAAPLHHAVFTR